MRKAFTALFLFLILNLCTSFLLAQVKIQERIELNPQSNTLPDSTNGLKNQVSLNKISNLQSTFNMPVRGKVKVEIISSDAAPSSRISLEIRQPEYKMLCEYGNHNVGFTWTSDIYEKNTPVEFGIDWYYNSWGTIYQGKEAGVRVTQINEDEYTMGFEAAGDDWDYNELIIKVNILPDSSTKLVILQPTVNSKNEHITHEPKMPTVICKAQLQNYNGGQVTYNWLYATADIFPQKTTGGKNLSSRRTGIRFSGKTMSTGSNVSEWQVPFKGVFTGGKTIIIVKAITNNGKSYSVTVHANTIIGDNPSPGEIANMGLTYAEETIITMESSNWNQFNASTIDGYNRNGYPRYGPPRGFGLMQLDNSPAATEQDLWNWRQNLSDGLIKFHKKQKQAAGYVGRIKKGKTWYKFRTPKGELKWERNDPISFTWYGNIPKGNPAGRYQMAYTNVKTLTNNQILKEAFQRYNGGAYWRWYPVKKADPKTSGKWKAEPKPGYGPKKTPYGDMAWIYYKKLQGGWLPTN